MEERFAYHNNTDLKRRSSLRNLDHNAADNSANEEFFAIITALSEDNPQGPRTQEEEDLTQIMMIAEAQRIRSDKANRGNTPSSEIAEDSSSVGIDDPLDNNEDNFSLTICCSNNLVNPRSNNSSVRSEGEEEECPEEAPDLLNKQADDRFIEPNTKDKENLSSDSTCTSNSTNASTTTAADLLTKELKNLSTPSQEPTSNKQERKLNLKRLSEDEEEGAEYDHPSLNMNSNKRLRPETGCNDIHRGETTRSKTSSDSEQRDVLKSKNDLCIAISNARKYHQEQEQTLQAAAAAAADDDESRIAPAEQSLEDTSTTSAAPSLPQGASTSLVSFHCYANGIPAPQAYQITTGISGATSTGGGGGAAESSQISMASNKVAEVPAAADLQQENSDHSFSIDHHQQPPSSYAATMVGDTVHNRTKSYSVTSNHSTSSAFTSVKRNPTATCSSHQSSVNLQEQGYETHEDSHSSSYHASGFHVPPYQHTKKEPTVDHDHATLAPAPYSHFSGEKVAGVHGMPSNGAGNGRYPNLQPAYQHLPHPPSPVRYSHHHHHHEGANQQYYHHCNYQQPNYDNSFVSSDPHTSNLHERAQRPHPSTYYQSSSGSSTYAPPPLQDSSSQHYFDNEVQEQQGTDSRDYRRGGVNPAATLYSRDSSHSHFVDRSASSMRRGGYNHMNPPPRHMMTSQQHYASSNPPPVYHQQRPQERYYDDREQGVTASTENHEPMPSLDAHPSSWHHQHNHHGRPSPIQPPGGSSAGQLLPYYNRQILPLSTSDDENWLSEFLCFVRSQCVEVFEASAEDVAARMNSKKVLKGQVGIRCRFCAHLPHRERTGRSSSFPSSINRIYQSLTMMLRDHFTKCDAMPPGLKDRYLCLKANASQGATDSKRYWIDSGKLFFSINFITLLTCTS